MLPKTFEGWLVLIAACVIGFFIGHLIRQRRSKSMAKHEPLIRIERSRQEKRTSKKARRNARRLAK